MNSTKRPMITSSKHVRNEIQESVPDLIDEQQVDSQYENGDHTTTVLIQSDVTRHAIHNRIDIDPEVVADMYRTSEEFDPSHLEY